MSTRSVIARPDGDGWYGRYMHWDGYPTWMGPHLWNMLHERFKGNVRKFLAYAIDKHPAGWSVLGERCYCHDENGKRLKGFGAKESHFHEHGPCTENSCDPLCIEWVWCFSDRTLSVFGTYYVNPDEPGAARYDLSHVYYKKHKLEAIIPLDGPEPDWESIETRYHAKAERALQETAA